MKKKLLMIIAIVVIISIIIVFVIIGNNNKNKSKYEYEWEEVQDSTIGQYRLYVNDKNGNHIDGHVDITYLNGKKETVEISKEGTLYVKSIIKDVSNVKK